MELERFKKGSTIRVNPGNDQTKMPPWMDKERFRRGQEFFKRHCVAIIFILHCSLAIGFVVTNLAQALIFTKKSDKPLKALHRYKKTFVHLVLWHTQDVWDENTLAHKSVQAVRNMHSGVSDAMESQGYKKSFVSQYDMALTQSGFMGGVILYASKFGISCTREEMEDYVFFWRGMGHLLGIQDEYNVCSGNFEQAHRVCKEITLDLVYPGLQAPPEEFDILANAYIDGQNIFAGYEHHTLKSLTSFLLGVSGMTLPSLGKLSFMDKLRVFWMKMTTVLIGWMPGFERLMNMLLMRRFKRMIPLIYRDLEMNGGNGMKRSAEATSVSYGS